MRSSHRSIAIAGVALMALGARAPELHAKGETKEITIAGGTLVAPIVITDSAILSRFNVWSGLGTRGSIQGVEWKATDGFVIASSTPVEKRPEDIHFPGRNDPHWRTNVFLILREIEGRWYEASRAWQDAITPLIR